MASFSQKALPRYFVNQGRMKARHRMAVTKYRGNKLFRLFSQGLSLRYA